MEPQLDLKWRKSSFSQGDGNCVEWAELPDGNFQFRNTRDRDGAVLTFTRGEIEAFDLGVKNNELLPPAQ